MSTVTPMYHVYTYFTTPYKYSSTKSKILRSGFGTMDVPRTSAVKMFLRGYIRSSRKELLNPMIRSMLAKLGSMKV